MSVEVPEQAARCRLPPTRFPSARESYHYFAIPSRPPLTGEIFSYPSPSVAPRGPCSNRIGEGRHNAAPKLTRPVPLIEGSEVRCDGLGRTQSLSSSALVLPSSAPRKQLRRSIIKPSHEAHLWASPSHERPARTIWSSISMQHLAPPHSTYRSTH